MLKTNAGTSDEVSNFDCRHVCDDEESHHEDLDESDHVQEDREDHDAAKPVQTCLFFGVVEPETRQSYSQSRVAFEKRTLSRALGHEVAAPPPLRQIRQAGHRVTSPTSMMHKIHAFWTRESGTPNLGLSKPARRFGW